MRPNILITGTPGVGKSRLATELAKLHKFKYLDVSSIAKSQKFILSHDEEYDCPVIDEDKVLDYMEPLMATGGNLVEYHSCELFPKRWFQAVYVVRCDNTILFDRLTKRGYNEKKLRSNVECEIFMEILNEAQDSYDADIVHELSGDSEDDFAKSVAIVTKFIKKKK